MIVLGDNEIIIPYWRNIQYIVLKSKDEKYQKCTITIYTEHPAPIVIANDTKQEVTKTLNRIMEFYEEDRKKELRL